MKNTLYRIIANSLAPENIEQFSQILTDKLDFTRDTVEKFIQGLPRVLYETHNGGKLKKVISAIKPANINLSIQKLVKEDNFPFYMESAQHRLISKIVNMTLRAGTDLALVYVVIEPGKSPRPPVSLIGRGEGIEDLFRLSDFVCVLDERSLLFLGFTTDNEGLQFLIPKLTKAVQAIVGQDASIKMGNAVFPKDGYTFSDIMRQAQKNLEKNQELPETPGEIKLVQMAGGKDVQNMQAKTSGFESTHSGQYFKNARGVFFYQLLDLPPETVWFGLKALTIKDQKRFVTRLPLNAKLVDYLPGKINSQADVKDIKTARKEIKHLVETTQIEKKLIERQRTSTAVVAMLNRVSSLPTIPAVAMEVYKLSIDPDSEIEDIQKILSTDQGLTLRILKLVNSPFYGLVQKVDSIREGIVILGMDEVAQLAFGLSLADSFSEVGIKGVVDSASLRRHAVETAITGLSLCKDMDDETFHGIFTACILHDIGKLFLIENFPDLYRNVVLQAKDKQLPLHTVEEEVFGFNHGVVGGIIAKKWNLPTSLVQAISFHHYPSDATKFQELAAVVGFADCLCHIPPLNGCDFKMEGELEWLMNKSIVDILQHIFGNISNEMLHDQKVKVEQFLFENKMMLGSISNE